MKVVASILVFVTLSSGAFSQSRPVSVFTAWGATGVFVRDAKQWSDSWYRTSRFFVTPAYTIGAGMKITDHFLADIAYTGFGADARTGYGSDGEYRFLLYGSQVPVNVTYQLLKPESRINIAVGAGARYTHAHLRQYENVSTGEIIHSKFRINRFNADYLMSVRVRLAENFNLSFNANVAVAGRFTGGINFLLRYVFSPR